MKIKFTSFPMSSNWVSGVVNDGQCQFEAKLYDKDSPHGINHGRVSKLTIRYKNTTGWHGVFVNYDRGWDIEPKTTEEYVILESVLNFLVNSPTRFI